MRQRGTARRPATPASRRAGDDVGGTLMLQDADPIFQGEFALLQALDADGVHPTRFDHCRDGGVEITMLLAELRELTPDMRFFFVAQAAAARCHDALRPAPIDRTPVAIL